MRRAPPAVGREDLASCASSPFTACGERGRGSLTVCAPASSPCTGAERVGRDYLTSLGRKPISAPSGLFATARLNYRQDVFARVGGPQSGDAPPHEGPGEKRTKSCARNARWGSDTLYLRPHSPKNELTPAWARLARSSPTRCGPFC